MLIRPLMSDVCSDKHLTRGNKFYTGLRLAGLGVSANWEEEKKTSIKICLRLENWEKTNKTSTKICLIKNLITFKLAAEILTRLSLSKPGGWQCVEREAKCLGFCKTAKGRTQLLLRVNQKKKSELYLTSSSSLFFIYFNIE